MIEGAILILHTHSIAVFRVSRAGQIIDWNAACHRLTGYASTEACGRHLEEIVAFLDHPGELPLARRDDERNKAYLVCKDGRRLAVCATLASNLPGSDTMCGFSVVLTPRSENLPARYDLIEYLPVAQVIEGLPCVFYVVDRRGRLLLWNHALEEALGMSSDELANRDVMEFFDAREHALIAEKIGHALEFGSSTVEAVIIGKNATPTPFLFTCARSTIDDVPCVVGTGLDISARRDMELSLRIRERALFSSVNAIVITCCKDDDNLIEYVNPAFEQMTGYCLQEIKGRDPRFMRVEGYDLDEHARIRNALKRRESVHSVLRNARKNGEIYWTDLRIDPVVNNDGEVTHFVGVIHDVTEARHYERRLKHLALHDPLTGLANRTLLLERLASAIEHAVRSEVTGALAFLDLDSFKYINDTFGHDLGDTVLKEIAERLKQCVRSDDTVARVGGDEFVMVINDQPSMTDMHELVERIRESVSLPVCAGGKTVLPAVSIGVSVFPSDGNTTEQVMRAADAAMYHAKALGKNNCQFYTAGLSQAMQSRLQMEANLGRAIRQEEMALHYQPRVDLRSGKIVGAEALVRWMHPDDGVLAPGQFITLAEETGLIVPLGEWVLTEACSTMRTLLGQGVDGFSMSVNLSASQLRHRRFSERVQEILEFYKVPPHLMEFEVTESQLMDNPAAAVTILRQLKALGVQLSIDDFGTGYSSLSYLRDFPLDHLKIDRSFIGDVSNAYQTVIARAIISLAHNLKLKVVAEGVETLEQLSFLREHACDEMQGFYFSTPLSGEQLQQTLREGKSLHH